MKKAMKQTGIGEIPVEWEVVALKDIAQRIKAKDSGGKHEVLTISAKVGFVRQEDKYNRYMAGKSVENYTLLKQGQFSYNKGNSLTYPFGCIYRLDDYDQALVPNVYISFELNHAVNSDFCRHLFLEGEFISRLKPFITSGVRSNGLLNVNAEDFFSLAMALPPLPEQRKIAEILSTLDEKMAVIDEQLAQTQEMKKGLMQCLLTIGVGHTQFKDSMLGKIPTVWEVAELGKYSSLMTNGFVGVAKPFYVEEGGTLYIQGANVRENSFNHKGIKYVSNEFSRKQQKSILKHGDLLTVQTGHIGTTAVVTRALEGSNCHALVITRLDQQQILPEFAAYYINSPFGKGQVKNIEVGSTIMHINVKDFMRFKLPIPPLPEQRQIAEILATVDDKISVLQDKKAQYHTLKRGLMQQLLTGQRRVRVAEQVPALV